MPLSPTLTRRLLGLSIGLLGSIGAHAHSARLPDGVPARGWEPPRVVVRTPWVVHPVAPVLTAVPALTPWPAYAPAPAYLHHRHNHHPRAHGWVRDDNHDGIVDGYPGPVRGGYRY